MTIIPAILLILIFIWFVVRPNLGELQDAHRHVDTSTRQYPEKDRPDDDPYDPLPDIRVGRVTYYHEGDPYYYELPGADLLHGSKKNEKLPG